MLLNFMEPTAVDTPPIPEPTVRSHRWPWIVLTGLLLVGLALRAHALGAHSFWMDEYLALELSTGRGFEEASFPLDVSTPVHSDFAYTHPAGLHPVDIWRKQVVDSHPPLHFIALGAWRTVFGSGEVAARSLSVLFSMIALIVVGLAVRQQVGWPPTLWVVAVLSVSGVQISYAQEARNYAMLLAILYSLAWLVLRAERVASISLGSAAAIAALMYAAVLTHYLSIGPLAAIGLYGVIVLRGLTRWRFVATAAIAGLLCTITWGPFLLQQAHNDIGAKMRWIGVDPTRGPLDVAKRLAIWSWNSLAIDETTPWRLRYFSALALAILSVMAIRIHRLRFWVAMFWGALLNVVLMDLLEHTDRLRITRYTIAAGPALCAAVILAADQSRWTRHAIPALLVLLCLARLPSAYALRNVDWRPLASYIDALHLTADDAIVIVGDRRAPWESQVYLLGLGHYARWPSPEAIPPIAILTRPPSGSMLQAMKSSQRTIVIEAEKSSVDRVLPSENLRALKSLPDLAEVYEWAALPSTRALP